MPVSRTSSLRVKLFDDSPSCVLYSRRKGGIAVGTCLAVERQVSSPEIMGGKKREEKKRK